MHHLTIRALVLLLSVAVGAAEDAAEASVAALVADLEQAQRTAHLIPGASLATLPPAALAAIEAARERDDLAWQTLSALERARGIIQARRDDQELTAAESERVANYRRELLAPYRDHGDRQPAWDEAALAGLTAAARYWADDPTRPVDSEQAAYRQLRAAHDAGCRDPLALYTLARIGTGLRANS